MLTGTYQDLLDYIKSDNVVGFGSVVDANQNYLALCYGRFPMLSICYLYDSNKIIKKFGAKLKNVTDYTIIDEDRAVYFKFKSIAGKALRLYTSENSRIVTPLEMLALKDDMVTFKTAYATSSHDAETFATLKKVFAVKYSENVSTYKGKFNCHRSRISGTVIVILCVVLLLSSLTIVAACGAKPLVAELFGMGTAERPYLVDSSEKLQLALDNNIEYIELTDDLTVADELVFASFGGCLLGNGHTVTLGATRENALFTTFTGKLSDVNIQIVESQGEAYRTIGLLVKDCVEDAFQEVNFIFRGNVYENIAYDFSIPFTIYSNEQFVAALKHDSESVVLKCDVYVDDGVYFENYSGSIDGEGHGISISGGNSALLGNFSGSIKNAVINIDGMCEVSGIRGCFTDINYGKIEDLVINFQCLVTDIESLSDDAVENIYTYFSLLAGQNYGTISNVKLNGSVTAKGNGSGDFYFGGVAGVNYGTVSDVVVSEESVITMENTDIGAVVAENALKDGTFGTITNSKNYARLQVCSNDAGWSILCGGICVYNYGNVEYCTNYGRIVADTEQSNIVGQPHIGGICAYNYNYILKCLNKGDLEYSSGTGCCVNLYIGGIVGGQEYVNAVDALAKIDCCGNFGNIKSDVYKVGNVDYTTADGGITTKEGYSFVFLGGIAGNSFGYAMGCFLLGEMQSNIYESDGVTLVTESPYSFLGALIGLGEYNSSMYNLDLWYGYYVAWSLAYDNNYYVAEESSTLTAIGATCQNGYKSISSGSSMGATAVESADALKAMEVYWDEG